MVNFSALNLVVHVISVRRLVICIHFYVESQNINKIKFTRGLHSNHGKTHLKMLNTGTIQEDS